MPKVNQTPEQKARDNIDAMLEQAGWLVQDKKKIDFSAGFGIAIREYQTDVGPADYVLFIDKKPVGVVEAKPEDWGQKITTVEEQSSGYASAKLKWVNKKEPLPFVYESTGCSRVSPTDAIRSLAPGRCSASLGRRRCRTGTLSRPRSVRGSRRFRVWTPPD